ncbi:hypothetical protein B0G80_4938 [Paraburkholderia sp. BL6669N2]|nr:hypothetical protein B0G80_4938 [Paraburkholderia sp. BL6669N2]
MQKRREFRALYRRITWLRFGGEPANGLNVESFTKKPAFHLLNRRPPTSNDATEPQQVEGFSFRRSALAPRTVSRLTVLLPNGKYSPA